MEFKILFLPSKVNGLVTIATTKISLPSMLLAILAITGAAPVPVPPPIPAAIKTMLASLTMSLILSALASAASFPHLGSPPAPSPPVSSSPRIIRLGALEVPRAWTSVLAT